MIATARKSSGRRQAGAEIEAHQGSTLRDPGNKMRDTPCRCPSWLRYFLQVIGLIDAEADSCIYVPITQAGKVGVCAGRRSEDNLLRGGDVLGPKLPRYPLNIIGAITIPIGLLVAERI
jgi:hypothetical protein